MAITFRTAHSANASSVAITTPAAGDLIVVFSFDNAAATIPTLAAGYTNVDSITTTLLGGRCAIKRSDGTETTSGTWTNATQVSVIIFRGAFSAVTAAHTVGTSVTLSYPTIALKNTSGSSWVACGACAKAATAGMNGAPAGLTNRTSQTTVNALDTNAGVASWAAHTLTVTTSGAWITFSIEIMPLPDITGEQLPLGVNALTTSDTAVIQLRGGSVDFNLQNLGETVATGTTGSEQLNITDALSLNLSFLELPSDALSITDALKIGFGHQLEDAISFSDQIAIGCGLQIADGLAEVQLASDTFVRANANPIGAPWVKPTDGFYGDLQIVSNSLCPAVTGGSTGISFYDGGVVWPSDQYSEVTIGAYLPSTGGEIAPGVRLTAADADGYYVRYTFQGGGNSIQIFKVVSSFRAFLGSAVTRTLNSGDKLRITAIGSRIVASVNGVPVIQLTDTSVPSGGKPGIWLSVGTLTTTDTKVSGWSAGDPANLVDYLGLGFGNLLSDTLSISDSYSQLLVGVLTVTDAIAVYSQATDDFNRGSLGANWTVPDPLIPPAIIVSNQIGLDDSVSSTAVALYGALGSLTDQFSQATLKAIAGVDTAVVVRCQLTLSPNYYMATADGGPGSGYVVYSLVGGTQHPLAIPVVTAVVGDVMRLEVRGTQLKFFVNGVLLSTVTDATFASGYPGLRMTDSQPSGQFGFFDDWSGGALDYDAILIGYGNIHSDTLTLSDDLRIGYGIQLSDTETLTDALVNILGFNKSFTDQLTQSQSLVLGYGSSVTETLTFVDSLRVGYGSLIADTLTLADSVAFLFTLSQSFSETLVITDSQALGYGFLISDALTLSDAEVTVLGINELLSDQVVLTDSLAIGYGNLVSDTLSLSDSVAILFTQGSAFSDTLIISDSQALGYGFAITDQIVLSDSAAFLMAIAGTFSDQIVLSDALAIGYGSAVTDALSLSDSARLVFSLGPSFSETLNITDSQSLGYGFAITDALTLTDSMTALMSVAGAFSDQIVMSDSSLLGYGNLVTDSFSLSDSAAFLFTLSMSITETLTISDSTSLGYGLQITDALTLADSSKQVLGIIELLSDTIVLADSIAAGYGNAVSDTIVLSDSARIGYGQANVDSLTFIDSASIGYGLQISDSIVFSDSVIEQLGLIELLTDQLSLSDSLVVGYGAATSDSMTLVESLAAGYGLLIADQIVLADSFQFSTGGGINEQLSDTLTMADSLAIGYGQANVDAMTFADSARVGYGDLISDTLALTDSEQNVLGFVKTFTEALVLTDSIVVGYGSATSDSMVLVESLAVGYGLLIADQIVLADSYSQQLITTNVELDENLSDALTLVDSLQIGYGNLYNDALTLVDSERNVLGMNEVLSDTVVLADSIQAGYGSLISDQIVLQDFAKIGYGSATSDQIVLSDSASVGYGALLSDQLVLSDSEVAVLGMLKAIADSFTLADSFAELLAGAIAVADTMTMADSLAVGYGNQFVEQLILVESSAIGYGDLIADSMNFWADSFAFSTGQPLINLLLSDAIAFLDSLQIGYGLQNTDQIVMSDTAKFEQSMQNALADATPAMLDAFKALLTFALSVEDAVVLQDQLLIMYGLLIADPNTMSDSLNAQLIGPLSIALVDSDVANWLDAVLAEMVFAPGEIVFRSITALNEMICQLENVPQQSVTRLTNMLEVTQANDASAEIDVESIKAEVD